MTDAPLVLIGNAKSGTITTLRLADGSLEKLTDSTVGEGCSTFAVDVARDLVHSAVKEPSPAIVTLSLDRATGALAEVRRSEVPDALAYLALVRDGSVLLGASYSGGWGSAWRVEDDGLSDPTSVVSHANAHSIVASPDEQYAYVVSLGEDLIAQCALDVDGTLAPLDPPVLGLPDGCGPRHLVFASDGLRGYVVTEFTGEVFELERNPEDGQLTLGDSVRAYATDRGLTDSELGAEPKPNHLVWGADVHLTADEAFLVASERTESTLATVALEDGRLREVVAVHDTETQPRGFAVAPDGRHLVVAGEASGGVELVRVADDGSLERVGRVDTGEGPNWVRFA